MKRTDKKKLTILTCDPSITGWGYAVISNNKIIASGCIRTAPNHKKKRIRKSDDTIRRIQEINDTLLRVISLHEVDFITSEAPHGSQSAVAAVMIGMVIGMLQTMSDALSIPIEWYSEADAKKAVLHKNSAAKIEMVSAISKLYEVPWTGVKYIDEAVADAVAVYHAAKRLSPTLKLFIN